MNDIEMAGEDKSHNKGKCIITFGRLYINTGDIKNN